MKQNATNLAIALIGIALAYLSFSSFGGGISMSWDAFGYYYYLPLTFLQDSMIIESLGEVKPLFEKYNPSSTIYQFSATENGRFIVMYTVGQALLYLPFFLLGHLGALLFGFDLDGFSAPYDFAIRMGGVFYHTAGFYFIGKLLAKRFRGSIVAISLIVLFFSTNAMLTLQAPLNAHGSLIFLLSALFYFTDKYYEKKKLSSLVAMAMTFGLACLCRPTDIIAIIPVIFWPWMIGKDLKTEWNDIFQNHTKNLIVGAAIVAAMGSIQMIYWKHAGGSFILDSYSNAAEGFDFFSPHTIPFLFGFKVGWFVYTPLMIFVMVYLIAKIIKGDRPMIVIGVYLAIFIYIASSWTNYWYGGSFSQRAMVQTYVLLSFPLAGLIQWVFNLESIVYRRLCFTGLALLCALNIWQSGQYLRGVFKPDTMTKEYYAASFFDYHFDPEKAHLLSIDRTYFQVNPVSEVPEGYALVKEFDYPLPEGSGLEGHEFTAAIEEEYRNLCPEEHCWLRMQVEMEEPLNGELLLVTHFQNRQGNYYYYAHDISQNNPLRLDQFLITPHVRSNRDKFKTYFWNRAGTAGTVKKAWLSVYAPSYE